MWNELTATRASDGVHKVTIEGEGAGAIPLDETNLIVVGAKAAFRAAGCDYVPLHYKCKNRIPFGRGLGSSSAAIVSGLMAGLALCGHELKVFGHDGMYQGGASIEPEELLQLASDIEGHPDNVCPCIYGGIQLGIRLRSGHWRSCRVNCPTDMQLVAFISNTVGKVSSVGGCSVLRGVVPRRFYQMQLFSLLCAPPSSCASPFYQSCRTLQILQLRMFIHQPIHPTNYRTHTHTHLHTRPRKHTD